MSKKDNDAEMLRTMGNMITDLQVKYRAASLEDQVALKTSLNELLLDYSDYQARLLKVGTITTDKELTEMIEIQRSVSESASKQDMLLAISKVIAFIASA